MTIALRFSDGCGFVDVIGFLQRSCEYVSFFCDFLAGVQVGGNLRIDISTDHKYPIVFKDPKASSFRNNLFELDFLRSAGA